MRALVVISTALNIAACWSLQLEPRWAGRSQGAPDNAILIRSKTYNVTEGEGNSSLPTPARRTVVVQREDSEENYAEPKLPQYAIDCGADKACLEAHGLDPPEGTFKPYTQEELERLLTQYAAGQGKTPEPGSPASKLATLYMDDEDAVINVLETKDQEKSKSASWHLLHAQKHDHPYEDEKGWVTLEPVPWAHSQIQKWEPHAKPQIPSWEPPPRPAPWPARPATERPWGKPTYEYKPSRPAAQYQYRPETQGSHWSQDIITDNQPGYFPQQQTGQRPWPDQEPYGSNRPPQAYQDRPLQQGGYHGRPSSHPSDGEGQWVLLSSTKGYSVPHRHRSAFQRALSFDTKASASSAAPTVSASVSSHRTVRLTVLPADNTTNTTLSHGGLLEVERTLQTVEEAQREHAAKMLRLQTLQPEGQTESTTSPSTTMGSRRSGEGVRVFAATPAEAQSKTAVLAAIGAGMIPATVAMLLPMVLGRRRRGAGAEDDRHENHTLVTFLKLQRPPGLFTGAKSNKEASY